MDEFAISAVGGTALIVASCRARLSRRPDPWFVDPLAVDLADRHAEWYTWPISHGLIAWVAVRTRFLDELVVAALQGGVRQVVILGAGLDARAFRLAVPTATRFFEIDRSDVLTVKDAAVEAADLHPVCDRRVVTADLVLDDWVAMLENAGWEPRAGTVWIAEGLLIYLDQGQRRILLEQLRAAGSADDVFGATITTRESVPDQPLWKATPAGGPQLWFADSGWHAHVRTMAEVSETYGYPVTAGRGLAGLIRAVPQDRGTPR